MANRSSGFSFFQDIHVTNGWHLQFPKAYHYKNRTAGIIREVKSLTTNQAGTGDIILSSDFRKTL